MRISVRIATVFVALTVSAAGAAQAASPVAQAMSVAGVFLEDDQSSPPPGWDNLLPEQAKLANDPTHTMILSAYVRSDNQGLRSILLIQTNLLPASVGWGPLAACAPHGSDTVATAYRSVRDLLCGWAQPVAFGTQGSDARLADPVLRALQARGGLPAAMAQSQQPAPKSVSHWLAWSEHMFGKSTATDPDTTDAPQWVLAGWRINDRHDVLDVQLLVRGDVAPSQPRVPLLLARATHAMGDTWRNGQPTEPAMAGASAPATNLFDGSTTQPPEKTFLARTAVTLENWAVAGVALGSSAAGMTMAAVQDLYSTAAKSANDYAWDRMSPARAESQDFVELVVPR
jgi:hypothetical protein